MVQYLVVKKHKNLSVVHPIIPDLIWYFYGNFLVLTLKEINVKKKEIVLNSFVKFHNKIIIIT
jgi:hypothetical protein